MGITMREIAALAGVSRQAVSAVFNNPGGCRIPESTQAKIRAVARQHGYVPNAMARALNGVPTKLIGIIGATPYFGVSTSLFLELRRILRDKEFDAIFSVAEGSIDDPAMEIRKLENKGVDGIISLYTSFERKFFSVPHVTAGSRQGYDICNNRQRGSYLAAGHLFWHGRRNVACLTISGHSARSSCSGWLQACQEKFGKCDESLALCGKSFGHDFDRLAAIIRERRIDGICAQNDYVAGRLVNELMCRGIKVPDDVAVIGYDGLSFCDFCTVPLATVITPVRAQAKMIMELLLKRIENGEVDVPCAEKCVEPVLYRSASCGCERCRTYPFYNINTYLSLELDAYFNHDVDILNQ